MEMRLEKAKDNFSIGCTTTGLKPTFTIEDAKLQLKVIKVHPAIMAEHANVLMLQMPAIYPINRVVIQHKNLKSGNKEFLFEHLFHGAVPKYLLAALVSHSAFYGDYARNPFNFKHYNLCS